MQEIREIIEKFASSGWDLIAEPSRRWLKGECTREAVL